MSFSTSRRSWILLLLLATASCVFILTRPASDPDNLKSPPMSLVPTVLDTPEPTFTVTVQATEVEKSSTPVLTPTAVKTTTTSSITESTAADVIDLKKIRSQDVKVDVHVIDQGENYWTLAKEANVDIYTLIGANPTLPFKASFHQKINLLSHKGVLHTVHSGDNLSKLADEYRTTEKVIQSANGLHWWHPMRNGDVLYIPDVRPVLMTKEWKDYYSKRGLFGVPFSRWATWTSGFGLRVDPFTGKHKEHTGVDLRAKYGDAVFASAPGKVIFTGVAGGYGNLIQIAHGHGYVTYYGHLSKIYARIGAKVRRGTLIGRVGATGRVTGPHLHFEIRLNGKPLDPLQFI